MKSPEHSNSDFGVLPEQGATGDQPPGGGHKSIHRQGQTQGACSSMVSQGQVFPTCSSHGSLPKHAQGGNVTTNNLDFNQEIAHPLLCPTYRPAEEKDTRKPRLCTGANRARPAPQPVFQYTPSPQNGSGRIPF